MKKYFSIVFLLSLASLSCDRLPSVRYSDFAVFPESGIPQNWQFDFNTAANDSSSFSPGKYNAVIVVRYTPECPSQSLILNLEEISLSHEAPDSTTFEIRLFDKEGKPLGKGAYGLYEISDTLHRGFSVPDGYILSFHSPLPEEKTVGIKAVGLVIN